MQSFFEKIKSAITGMFDPSNPNRKYYILIMLICSIWCAGYLAGAF